MTLILCLGNREQFIQLSDRRLTVNGALVDDENNKAGVLHCTNARFAFGFTGLAAIGNSFKTDQWLLDKIHESCKDVNTADKILQRLKTSINNEFKSNPLISSIPLGQKALSIVFTGYLFDFNPPLAVCAIISNYYKKPKVQNEFNFTIMNSKEVPLEENFAFMINLGYTRGLVKSDFDDLQGMLMSHKPSKAIIDKAVFLINQVADRPQSQGFIGKQISSIVIPRDILKTANAGYHSNVLSTSMYLPNVVFAPQDGGASAIRGFSMKAVDTNAPPMVYPKWPKNKLCPCGSGKKYKYCHGK